MKKVFISSVMRDYSLERAAARTAVESLRQKAVMAEDFGAKPFSSQIACLDGVRQSDIYIGIMGARYGFTTDAQISVTEEEFNEARRRGLPILWFVQKVQRESDQQAFFERLGNYKDGYFLDFFENPQELQIKVTRSLFDYIAQPDVSSLDSIGANRHVAKYVKAKQHFPEHTSYFTWIIFPLRQGEMYLSPLDLGREDLKEGLMQRALFGKGAVLRPSLATATLEGQQHLIFMQTGKHNRPAASVEIHCDGTLVFTSALGDDGNRDLMVGGLGSYVVDEDEVRTRLEAMLQFANMFYSNLEASHSLSSFYAAMLFHNLAYKWFGHRPEMQINTMAMPMNTLPDPVMIPTEPLKVARAELNNNEVLIDKFIAFAQRMFKSQNRYFNPKR